MTDLRLEVRGQALTPPVSFDEHLELVVGHLGIALIPAQECAAAPQVCAGEGCCGR
jgi:hypothetical protein